MAVPILRVPTRLTDLVTGVSEVITISPLPIAPEDIFCLLSRNSFMICLLWLF